MSNNKNIKSDGQLEWSRKAAAEFDWSLYEDGWDGTGLRVNKKVKTKSKKDLVFCHEKYAQELYDLYENNGMPAEGGGKDLSVNTVVMAKTMTMISDHEISLDTDAGLTVIVDMNKEKQFIDACNGSSVREFMNEIAKPDSEFRDALLNQGVYAKQVKGGRTSLWEGHIAKIQSEFTEQLKNPTFAYKAKVLDANNGGYIVDVQGVRCFMPGSLAAAGVITDFSELIGKEVPVMVINYVKNLGFIVSYKKYLSTILPHKIETELVVGQQITGRVTGCSKFGVFVQFPDANGEWVFSGLVHTSTMSKDFRRDFDAHRIDTGAGVDLYISNIVFEPKRQRIILTDVNPLDRLKAAFDSSVSEKRRK